MQNQDFQFMARALKLAEKGIYTTDPNPRVGCVLVKAGEIIAEGWHFQAGTAHAEIDALRKADQTTGATAYVTLEPCSHTGRTGPCCDALITAGIQRVVIAMQDPNPLVAGQGIQRMLQAGLTVDCGLLETDAKQLNQGFIKRMETGLPYLRSKLAMSLDGRTAMASGESQWITGEQARADVQRLRAASSAVLTGVNTVLADNPGLNVRLDTPLIQPVRVILDSTLRTPENARILGLEGETWVLTCADHQKKIDALESAGGQVFQLPGKKGQLDLSAVMAFLGEKQLNTVLVEAGAILNGALLREHQIDEWIIYMAPCILGDQGRGLFHLPNFTTMADKKQLRLQETRQVGVDLRLRLTSECIKPAEQH